ncbi:MAG TPA: aminoglycoside phosphotransferase family protein [Candidatus Limiplasma sp.]|nr:aminoglycoside phosphotransferase family protein [Candidatus Limiplasma sp.]
MTQQNHSLKTEQANIPAQALRHAVGIMLGVPIVHADYQAKPLHGGTLGDVQLITGEAASADGKAQPFRIVLKTQKHWQRPGDPLSWRREYDLFQSVLSGVFTPSFRSPRIYHAGIGDTFNQLWMEYIEGASGAQLTIDAMERAAFALGCFQGRCHQQASALRAISCLGDMAYLQRDFAQWTPYTMEYRYLHSDDCTLPQHLRQMLIHIQKNADAIFKELRALPQVLCHRDYWTENIFVKGDTVVAIDWDTAGWGIPGEDIASLIADETDATQIGAYYRRLVPAYRRGLSGAVTLPPAEALPIKEMILFKFGYRLLQQFMFSPSSEAKAQAIVALEQIRALPDYPTL